MSDAERRTVGDIEDADDAIDTDRQIRAAPSGDVHPERQGDANHVTIMFL